MMANLAFGERYGDDSGWEWLVSWERTTDGGSQVTITASGDKLWFSTASIDPRDIATALIRIADELDDNATDERREVAATRPERMTGEGSRDAK